MSFDNRFKVSTSSFVMLRWREGLLFFRIEIVLALMKFADSGGRCLMPDSTDDIGQTSRALKSQYTFRGVSRPSNVARPV